MHLPLDPRSESERRIVTEKIAEELRAAGVSLPPGMGIQDLERAMIAQLQAFAGDPKLQERSRRIDEIVRQVASELPGGIDNPEFATRVAERLQTGDDTPSASA